MQLSRIWITGSSDPENTSHLAVIRQWWAGLTGQEVTWRQRLIPPTAHVSELDWNSQRFDEQFLITMPEMRGITLYWHRPDNAQERSITPHKLELDTLHQRLYIFPQSQREVVIEVGIPEPVYQSIVLHHPQIQYQSDTRTLELRDNNQQLDVTVTLSAEGLAQLKQQLG